VSELRELFDDFSKLETSLICGDGGASEASADVKCGKVTFKAVLKLMKLIRKVTKEFYIKNFGTFFGVVQCGASEASVEKYNK